MGRAAPFDKDSLARNPFSIYYIRRRGGRRFLCLVLQLIFPLGELHFLPPIAAAEEERAREAFSETSSSSSTPPAVIGGTLRGAGPLWIIYIIFARLFLWGGSVLDCGSGDDGREGESEKFLTAREVDCGDGWARMVIRRDRQVCYALIVCNSWEHCFTRREFLRRCGLPRGKCFSKETKCF